MADIPTHLKYASSHEWVSVEDDTATIGISDHAQEELTELVFIELPDLGRELTAGDTCAVVESVKTASDIYAPLSGEIIDTNDALDTQPGTVNDDPYGDGWFFKIRLTNPKELDNLLSPDDYAEQVNI
ncbi:glycine cleavage system protein GcvH [bacterium]|jgi:glycine cleavage system H protein|nr:glycine cleavage system protein GcvH [bacterium]|tara:strand:- start:639 stop:1022 length:384 start_codon:yes stop_codon:yes gene_type:complete